MTSPVAEVLRSQDTGACRSGTGLSTFGSNQQAVSPLRASIPSAVVKLRPPLTYAEALEGARKRQAGRGIANRLFTVTDEELARADAQMEMWSPVSARIPCVPEQSS